MIVTYVPKTGIVAVVVVDFIVGKFWSPAPENSWLWLILGLSVDIV